MRALRSLWLSSAALGGVVVIILLSLTVSVVLHFRGTSDLQAGQGSGIACGLVFGAAVHRNSLPGPGIARRVATAARLYHEKLLQHIILTGGKGGDSVESEAEVMRDRALEDGIKEGDLTLEGESKSTWENLALSRPLTGSCSSVIGISDRYHLARISFLARLQGWEGLETLPSDQEAPWYFEVRSIGREVAAMVYYIVLSPFLKYDSTTLVSPKAGPATFRLIDHETYSFDLSIAFLT